MIDSGTLADVLVADDAFEFEIDASGALFDELSDDSDDVIPVVALAVVVAVDALPADVALLMVLLSVPSILSVVHRLSLSILLTSAGFVSIPLKLLLPVFIGLESLSNGCDNSEPGSLNENDENTSSPLSKVFDTSNVAENSWEGDKASIFRIFDSRKSVPSSWRICSLFGSDRFIGV